VLLGLIATLGWLVAARVSITPAPTSSLLFILFAQDVQHRGIRALTSGNHYETFPMSAPANRYEP